MTAIMYDVHTVKRVLLSKNKFCLVDDIDYEELSKIKWSYSRNGYAHAYSVVGGYFYMHRYVLGFPEGSIDHINRNKLDNRRGNLRICTQRQNVFNTPGNLVKKYSQFKGVGFDHRKKVNKWRSYITPNKRMISLGYYLTEKEAAIAYNEAATLYFGEYAYLNEVKSSG